MSSILDYHLDRDSVPDPQVLPAGEYEVKITSAKPKTSQAGKPMVEVAIGFPNELQAKTCFHYVTLPADSDEADTVQSKLRNLRNFYEAFGVDYSGPVDLDLMIGETCFAIITEEEATDEYEASNRVKRFMASK